MMRGGLTAVETSGKIAMGVLAFHRIAPRIFQEMHRSRSIYFATSTLRSICHTTALTSQFCEPVRVAMHNFRIPSERWNRNSETLLSMN
jgi:hypothetical protein